MSNILTASAVQKISRAYHL